jgi:cytochrome P450
MNERIWEAGEFDSLPPSVKTILFEDNNGSLDVESPQQEYASILDELPRAIRWEKGVTFFRFEDALKVTHDLKVTSNNPDGGTPINMGAREALIPLHVDGAVHNSYRRVLNPEFAPRKLRYLEDQLREFANSLIDTFIERGASDFYADFAVPFPCITFLRLLGLPVEDLDLLLTFKDGILHTGGKDRAEIYERQVPVADALRDYLAGHLDRRVAEGGGGEDVISLLLNTKSLSREEILNICHMLTVAGLDTVTGALTTSISWLSRHPDVRDELIEDPSKWPAAIEELMRLESPSLYSSPRWAAEDAEIAGVPVKEGDAVSVCWATANLDPEQFTDPLELDLDRPANRHIALGAGWHRCLGSHLARLELLIAMEEFHRRIPIYTIDPNETPVYSHAGVRQVTYLPILFDAAPALTTVGD